MKFEALKNRKADVHCEFQLLTSFFKLSGALLSFLWSQVHKLTRFWPGYTRSRDMSYGRQPFKELVIPNTCRKDPFAYTSSHCPKYTSSHDFFVPIFAVFGKYPNLIQILALPSNPGSAYAPSEGKKSFLHPKTATATAKHLKILKWRLFLTRDR